MLGKEGMVMGERGDWSLCAHGEDRPQNLETLFQWPVCTNQTLPSKDCPPSHTVPPASDRVFTKEWVNEGHFAVKSLVSSSFCLPWILPASLFLTPSLYIPHLDRVSHTLSAPGAGLWPGSSPHQYFQQTSPLVMLHSPHQKLIGHRFFFSWLKCTSFPCLH